MKYKILFFYYLGQWYYLEQFYQQKLLFFKH
jgi:hypothetical protein